MDTGRSVPAMRRADVLADRVLVDHAAARDAYVRVLRGGERNNDERDEPAAAEVVTMNYEEPRQVDPKSDRPDAGKWRWTSANRRTGTYATGYCSPWETCPACGGKTAQGAIRFGGFEVDPGDSCDTCENNGIVKKAEPCPGHDTAEAAAEHYRQYRLDHVRFRTLDNPNALHKCRVNDCGQFTAGVMEIEGDGYYMETVCETHQTRETAEQLIGVVTSTMHS